MLKFIKRILSKSGWIKGSTAFGLYIIATILEYMAVALAIVFWVNA